MTYACLHQGVCVICSPLEIACLKNGVLRSIGNLDRCTSIHKLHVAFKIPYVYDCVAKLCRTQAGVVLNHVNLNVHGTGQRETRHRKCKRLKLGGNQTYDHSAD
jgi:hypothetical protein